jgi:serine/threonine protein kinase
LGVTKVALKSITKSDKNLTEQQIIDIMQEVESMDRVKHPKILQNFGFWKDKDGRLYWAINLCTGGDLSKLLHKSKFNPFYFYLIFQVKFPLSIRQRVEITIDVIEGIAGFHSKNVLHKDIKPLNVLLVRPVKNQTSSVSAILSDYGTARDMNAQHIKFLRKNLDDIDIDDGFTSAYMTPSYSAPEVITGDVRNIDIKADIYSLGILIWEVFTGRIPKMLVKYGIDNKIEYIPNTPREIKDLIKICTSINQNERPTIKEVYRKFKEIEESLENEVCDENINEINDSKVNEKISDNINVSKVDEKIPDNINVSKVEEKKTGIVVIEKLDMCGGDVEIIKVKNLEEAKEIAKKWITDSTKCASLYQDKMCLKNIHKTNPSCSTNHDICTSFFFGETIPNHPGLHLIHGVNFWGGDQSSCKIKNKDHAIELAKDWITDDHKISGIHGDGTWFKKIKDTNPSAEWIDTHKICCSILKGKMLVEKK